MEEGDGQGEEHGEKEGLESADPINPLEDLELFWSSSLPHLALSLDGQSGHTTCVVHFT